MGRNKSAQQQQQQQRVVSSQSSSIYRPAYESTETRTALDFLGAERSMSFEDDDEVNLRCPRCNDTMAEPRLLDCLHPICTRCVDELFNNNQNSEDTRREKLWYDSDKCPVCDYPLPRAGSGPVPPPHYPLQHRLVINAIRLSHRVLCCDLCAEEIQASVHCPTCLGNFCTCCGREHQEKNDSQQHRVGPIWEAKRFRTTTLCLEHPTHALRFHCIACRRVTCRECMWRGGAHRGHASEGATEAGRRWTVLLIAAIQRARTLLNSLLTEYDDRSFARHSSRYNYTKLSAAETKNCHAIEARVRINEFARLQRARYLLDAISLGEQLVAEASDVEILSLGRIIVNRLQMLGSDIYESKKNHDKDYLEKYKSRMGGHTGLFHCCTFCSSGGRKEATCACRGRMPGGYAGCGHGHPGHPRVRHWSCCGSSNRYGSCLLSPLPKLRYQVVL